MKFQVIQLSNGKNSQQNSSTKVFLVTLSLILISSIPLGLLKSSHSPLPSPKINISSLRSIELDNKCDVFKGKWVPHPQGPYYTNETCRLIIDQHNCMKFGRPDSEFMKWRWKPDDCVLPLFDAAQFLEMVRGKSMAFVGDSVGRNQMQSLLCLLADVAYPEDISDKLSADTNYFKRLFYADYNFTLATFWSPFLVKSRDADPDGHSYNSLMSLYLDEADEAWANEIENFDYVIISAGQWFFRPLLFYNKGQLVGCHKCNGNITSLTRYSAYRMAFRTAFRTLLSLKNYKGTTFLRTFSASHFENGDWDKGGSCARIRPITGQEMKLEEFNMEFYLTQVEELRTAEKEGKTTGLTFQLLNTTEIMWLRPDGHPNSYGHSMNRNATVNDCVHWCLPGPIDTWNEFLLYLMKRDALQRLRAKLMKNA
ncbi:protein trichome birefringence-like 19 isoform X2 [Durio zibethinus]|uniref:Protein trichome birefringence-like 19 isoform X2 n=1 Tax=Durio zibethinus TaxID=66656 RepID=A0A6P6A2X5_DURZI|nr:protein trichome birefringence-like 19 isoform X2 [Durio zibethinus]